MINSSSSLCSCGYARKMYVLIYPHGMADDSIIAQAPGQLQAQEALFLSGRVKGPVDIDNEIRSITIAAVYRHAHEATGFHRQ